MRKPRQNAYSMFRWKIAQWFELRWWKRYLKNKDKEEYLNWKRNYWRQLLKQVSDVLVIPPNAKVCDLGCGPAGVFMVLSDCKVTAVDPLVDAYERETPFFAPRDYPNVTFVNSTIEAFSVQDKFERVFCMNCINHVRDLEKGFEQLKALCAEGGTLILTVDAHHFSFFKHLFRIIPGDVLHPHQYDLAEYQTFLEEQGFEILKTELLKQEFFFGHWVIVARKLNSQPV